MKYIWSPWRMEYIESHKSEEKCVFCQALAKPDGLDNLIVHRADRSFVILNRYPYTSGHLMVVPFVHAATLADLEPETRAELMELANQGLQVLQSVYRAQGFNVGINLGEAAGAGILDHVHLHLVPRWVGDTNFMSSLGETRVLPESLADSYQKVQAAWQQS